MFNQLLGSALLDEPLRRLLLRDRNFEDVLASLQQASDRESKDRYNLLLSELVGIFNAMGLALNSREFEFRNPPDLRYSIASFLQRFDAIFTLNQDTLLEQKYIPFVGPPWGRADFPGMKHLASFVPSGAIQDRIAVMEPNPSGFKISPGVQPYIKLHGSCNWVTGTSGPRLLIMGGQKAITIGQFPVLSWYYEEFRKHLKRRDAKLMIVGYSFSDAHINEAILDGIKSGNLKIFIIDSAGLNILDKRDPRAQIPDRPGELMELISPRLIGLSTRPLESTFNQDTVEHANVSRFFT